LAGTGIHLVSSVIPAVGGGDPSEEKRTWIPASARMTEKGVGMTEWGLGFPFPTFVLARRSATARKREDRLHGNDGGEFLHSLNSISFLDK